MLSMVSICIHMVSVVQGAVQKKRVGCKRIAVMSLSLRGSSVPQSVTKSITFFSSDWSCFTWTTRVQTEGGLKDNLSEGRHSKICYC